MSNTKYSSIIVIISTISFFLSCSKKSNVIEYRYHPRVSQRGLPLITKFDSTSLFIINSKLQRTVIDFGADPRGVENAVQAFRAARDYAVIYKVPIYIPNGVYNLSDSIQIPGGVNVLGEDKEHTIVYNNSLIKDRATFVIKNNTGIAFGNEISNIFILTGVNTNDHVGIEVLDASGFHIHDCKILGSPYFAGIGLKINGREGGSIHDMLIYADNPIFMGNNPNSTLDADHLNFNNMFLGANKRPVVEIEDDVFLTNVSFTGFQAWVGGSYGLKWVDRTCIAVSTTLRLDNIRWEQQNNDNGYMVYIDLKAGLQSLIINNMYGGLTTNGFFIRKNIMVSINDSQYIGQKVGIDAVGFPSASVLVRNSNIQGELKLNNYRRNTFENVNNYNFTYEKDVSQINFPILTMDPKSSKDVKINSIFIDASDNKLKFKDAKGNINNLY